MAWRRHLALWCWGSQSFDPELPVYDVIANKVGSPRHADMLKEGLPAGIRLLGAIPRNDAMHIPDRHLGLMQPSELGNLDQQLDDAAQVLKDAGLDQLPKAVTIAAAEPAAAPGPLLAGFRIAIACDAAFSFIYRANTELLLAMGAELDYFPHCSTPSYRQPMPYGCQVVTPNSMPVLWPITLRCWKLFAPFIRPASRYWPRVAV